MRALPLMVVLALFAPQLGGCAAASRAAITRAASTTQPVAAISEAPPQITPEPTAAPVMEVAAGVMDELRAANPEGVQPTERLARDDAGYAAMTAYLLAQIGDGKALPGRNSALIDQRSLARVPRMAACADQRAALIIDLDRGSDPFDLDDAPTPEPGLAEHLRTIRGRGLAVVWLASQPQSAQRQLLTIIKASGLDPLGLDQALLLRTDETRKQQILNRASEDWCVLAVAGDRRSDFDEVFDYLRNPDGPVALALEQHIGAGWFLVPPPIR